MQNCCSVSGTSFKWAATVTILQDVFISLEWFCCKRGVLNQIMQLMEFWHGLVNQNSSVIHPQSQGSANSIICEPDDHLVYGIQGVFVCHPISQGQIVNTQFYSHFSSTICVVQLGRNVQNLLKMGSFLHWGGGMCYSANPILTSVHVPMIWFQNWDNHYMANDL